MIVDIITHEPRGFLDKLKALFRAVEIHQQRQRQQENHHCRNQRQPAGVAIAMRVGAAAEIGDDRADQRQDNKDR